MHSPMRLALLPAQFAVKWTILAFCTVVSQSASAGIVAFDPPGSIQTEPTAVNNKGWITGFYMDSKMKFHSFLRAPNGALTEFDVKGAKCGDGAWSINKRRVITGTYYDRSCNGHGFVRAAGGAITTFDVKELGAN